MNLFSARVSRDGLTIGGQTLPLRAVEVDSVRTAGVRPEAVRVNAGNGSDHALRATLEHVEYLGHETLAHVSIEGGVRMVARVDGMPGFQRGETVDVAIDPGAVHLFDEAGRRLPG